MKNYSQKDLAYMEGKRIAQMINNQWVKPLNTELFPGDSLNSVDARLMLIGFYHGVKNTKNNLQIIQAQTIAQGKIEAIKTHYLREKYADRIAVNEKYLEDNKSKEGVETLESGLQYKIITEGKGAVPERNSLVKVNYRGTLIDGTEFDSSYKNNAPSAFRVSQVIKGWTEALCLMPVGSKWELYIPQNLAYGSADQGTIPPFSTLIFEVELLEIVE